MELKEWLDRHKIQYRLGKDVLFVPGWGKALIQDMSKREHIFKTDKDGNTIFSSVEVYDYLLNDGIQYIVFQFGDRWYYMDVQDEKQQFRILRYVGESVKPEIEYEYYPLGVHSGYELLNGSGLLKDWVAKAKFYGFKGLGTCEKNTFAASLDLQNSATAAGMKYCFGYSLTMEIAEDKVDAKIYVNTQKGFQNVLRIQKAIGVDREDGLIDYVEVLNRAEGNCIVFGKKTGAWLAEHTDKLQEFIDAFDGWVFFQVDLSEYCADRIDKEVLESTKAWFDAFYIKPHTYQFDMMPILLQDVYYLDEDDWKNKVILNKVDIGAAHEKSYRQFMKTLDEMYDEFYNTFSEKYGDDVFEDMCKATVDIAENADAGYDLTENYAPKYDMTDEEKLLYGDVHTMFNELLEQGFKELVPEGQEAIYRERLEYEKYVIESTDNVHYYLITWDQVNYARKCGELVGIGRGSAGGCLLSYLLHITSIDPIKWGLIFERFLLPERGGLAPRELTKVCEDVSSNDYVELELENGKTYKFDKDAQFLVVRDGQEIKIYADELQEGDDILWDRRDELFTLSER